MTCWDWFLGFSQEEGEERGGGGGGPPKKGKWDVLVLMKDNVVSLFLCHLSRNLNQSRMGFFLYHASMKQADIWFVTNNWYILVCFIKRNHKWKDSWKLNCKENNKDEEIMRRKKLDRHKEEKTKTKQRWITERSWKICQSRFSSCHILLSNLVTGPSSWAGSDQKNMKKKGRREDTDRQRERKVGVENKIHQLVCFHLSLTIHPPLASNSVTEYCATHTHTHTR